MIDEHVRPSLSSVTIIIQLFMFTYIVFTKAESTVLVNKQSLHLSEQSSLLAVTVLFQKYYMIVSKIPNLSNMLIIANKKKKIFQLSCYKHVLTISGPIDIIISLPLSMCMYVYVIILHFSIIMTKATLSKATGLKLETKSWDSLKGTEIQKVVPIPEY